MTRRLRHRVTGSIVCVDDVTAAQLGPEWEPHDPEVSPKSAVKRASAGAKSK